jgi:23S rRNA pseudouridine2457 synthase
MRLHLLNKPFRVLTRFSPADGRPTLADCLSLPGLRPAGRLDYDSEGLLLLTDSGPLQAAITHPRHALEKTYWAQVEGVPTDAALARLRNGVALSDGMTRPAGARVIPPPPGLWVRDPPIRYRARIPTAWLELRLREGRNRQVRRMTAAVGLPTLRLVRATVGPLSVAGLAPGAHREATSAEIAALCAAVGLSRSRNARSASRPRAPARS